MASWSRKEALMTMTSPLGPDELVPIGLSGREAINEPFRFQVDAGVYSDQGPSSKRHE